MTNDILWTLQPGDFRNCGMFMNTSDGRVYIVISYILVFPLGEFMDCGIICTVELPEVDPL